jgi:hypothetical protein
MPKRHLSHCPHQMIGSSVERNGDSNPLLQVFEDPWIGLLSTRLVPGAPLEELALAHGSAPV